jgi:hypothetical protein
MGLDKAILSGKEHRKKYHGSKAIDCSCRNHGSCDWCLANRLFQKKKEIEKLDFSLKEYYSQN